MATRMLIDATHPEETRVVVVKGTRLEEFDFETSTKRPLKGNIYLAKVTRVEPSLQAAFVEYGGNRHGFLAFGEIHPDYYQIPVADREALLQHQAAADAAAEAAEAAAEAAADAAHGTPSEGDGGGEAMAAMALAVNSDAVEGEVAAYDRGTDSLEGDGESDEGASHEDGDDNGDEAESEEAEPGEETVGRGRGRGRRRRNGDDNGNGDGNGDGNGNGSGHSEITSVGGDVMDEVTQRRPPPVRTYKIQEVIKRRQVLLVQVVKEERGNKGAALTTYLSLAGRYCVLMPNSARGGGISRKIVSTADRKRLKSIASELDVPEGMGVILRTAGMDRTKAEIKRDFEYLLRLWDNVRELTLQSTAPCLVYEEGSLIKRAIRDYYSAEIDEILVEGEEAYRTAKDFMRMLMPSHAKRVQPYRERSHLFHKYQVDQQFDSMYSPTVQLRSGGYIVINPTEALVSIDVNSGKSTREHNIEETAYKTNLEAAEEIARQLRLRDLAGLIVIDFIDMEESRNNRNVERRLKDCLKIDRARIQVGRISGFGLLEMSRQRLRPSLIEASTETCTHCQGLGYIRSTESTALHVLRAIEDEGMRDRSAEITLHVATSVAIYLLNQKRPAILDIEGRYGMRVLIEADDTLVPPAHRIDRVKTRPPLGDAARPVSTVTVPMDDDEDDRLVEDAAGAPETDRTEAPAREGNGADDGDGGRRRKRRRRRPRRNGEDGVNADIEAANGQPGQGGDTEGTGEDRDGEAAEAEGEERPLQADGEEDGEAARKRRRRGRRGGRRRRRDGDNVENGQNGENGENGESLDGEGEAPAVTVAEETTGIGHVPETLPDTPDLPPPSDPASADERLAETGEDSAADLESATVLPMRRGPIAPEAEAAVEIAPPVPEAMPQAAPEPALEPAPKAASQPEPSPEAGAEPEPQIAQPAADALGDDSESAAGSPDEELPAAAATEEEPAEPPPAAPSRRGWWRRG